MKFWPKSIAFLFTLPVIALVFFNFAPRTLSSGVRSQILENIESSAQTSEQKASYKEFFEKLDFMNLCQQKNEKERTLVQDLRFEDVCQDFTYFGYARLASTILILLGLTQLVSSRLFSTWAGRSRQALITSFKIGWQVSMIMTIVTLIGQALLAAATFYFMTTLWFNIYLPKIILVILISAAIGLFKIAQIIFQKQTIESKEFLVEVITEKQSPQLWQTVKALADKLQTTPPDNILAGYSTSFYVTEFPVRHSQGVVQGRTLYLSATLMKQLSLEETSAIIGHELGHFKGEDTVLTQKLSPMLIKSEYTLGHLAGIGVVGFPAFYSLGVFSHAFENVIASFKRGREFQADVHGSEVTDKKTIAQALMRYTFYAKAYNQGLDLHLRTGAVALDESVQQQAQSLMNDEEFWSSVVKDKTPHPFDSHPPMVQRIEKMGFTITELRPIVTQPVSSTAFDFFFSDQSVFRGLDQRHQELIIETQESLSLKSDEKVSPELLQKHFPTVVYGPSSTFAYTFSILFVFLASMIALGAWVSQEWILRSLFGVVAGLMFYVAWGFFVMFKSYTATLTATGIKLSKWSRALDFTDVQAITFLNNQGLKQVNFVLKNKIAPLNSKSVFKRKIKSATINLSALKGDSNKMVNEIYRYFVREKKVETY